MSIKDAQQHCIQALEEELAILKNVDFSQPISTETLFKIIFRTSLVHKNGILEQLVKEIHPDAKRCNLIIGCKTETDVVRQVEMEVPLDCNETVMLRLEEYHGQPQISIVDHWLFPKPKPFSEYLLENKREDECFYEKYLEVCENHAGWLEKARVRHRNANNKSSISLFFWWFFKIKPRDKCDVQYCKEYLDFIRQRHTDTYNSHVKRYNKSVQLSQSIVYQLVPFLEQKCTRVIVADGIRQQAGEDYLPLL